MTYFIGSLGECIVGQLPDNTYWNYNRVIGLLEGAVELKLISLKRW